MLKDRRLNKSVPVPLHYQLKLILEEEIENGDYPVGSMIPPEMEISEMFGVSRTTVRQAVGALVTDKKLYRIKSKGTFVSRPAVQQEFMSRIQSFNEEMVAHGRTPRTEVLALEIVDMPEKVKEITRNWDGKAVFLFRRRYADDEAVVCVKSYIPHELCSTLTEHDFRSESLYAVLSGDERTRVTRVSRECEAVAADKDDAELLSVRRGVPIQFITTVGYNRFGDVVEYSLARYRGDRNKFHVDLTL